jgi:cytochrome c oxidase assembly protein subunit 11
MSQSRSLASRKCFHWILPRHRVGLEGRKRFFSETSSTFLASVNTNRDQYIKAQYERARAVHQARRNRSFLLYSSATIILVTAASYLSVPLYRAFCSATGYGGTPQTDRSRFGSERLVPAPVNRRIRVHFNADASDSLPWSFTPQQKEVQVLPGETALAFYTATNHSSDDIIGIATYNVTPGQVSKANEFKTI